jgi:hypothetical protein
MDEPSEKQADQPTEEQLREADRNGVLRWKETQDIVHIKTAVPNGCVCDLCETVRSLVKGQTAGNWPYASPSVIRRLDFLSRMRKDTASLRSEH